jgi:hypothetical protein
MLDAERIVAIGVAQRAPHRARLGQQTSMWRIDQSSSCSVGGRAVQLAARSAGISSASDRSNGSAMFMAASSQADMQIHIAR